MAKNYCAECGDENTPIEIGNAGCKEACEDQPCYETTPAKCVVWTGDDITIEDEEIATEGLGIEDVIRNITDYITPADEPDVPEEPVEELVCGQRIVYPYDFEATGDNVADDKTPLQNMINSCHNVFDGLGKTYYITNTLNLKENMELSNMKIRLLESSAAKVLSLEKPFLSNFTIGSNVSAGAITVTLSSLIGTTPGVTIEEGDYIRISASKSWQGGIADSTPSSETNRVKSISGTTITLMDPLLTDYATSDNALVTKMDMAKNVTLRNIEIEGLNSTETVIFQGCANLTLENVSIKGGGGNTLKLRNCYGVKVADCKIITPTDIVGDKKGISIENGCHKVDVERTLVNGASIGIYLKTSTGMNQKINIRDCEMKNISLKGIFGDTAAFDINILGNAIHFLKGGLNSTYGVDITGGQVTVEDNKFYNVSFQPVKINHRLNVSFSKKLFILIKNNTAEFTTPIGSNASCYSAKITSTQPVVLINHITISGNTAFGVDGALASFIDTGVTINNIGSVGTVNIVGNTYDNTVLFSSIIVSGLTTANVKKVNITGNTVKVIDNGEADVAFNNCIKVTADASSKVVSLNISGNNLEGGQAAIYLRQITTATVSANTYHNVGTRLNQASVTNLSNYDV